MERRRRLSQDNLPVVDLGRVTGELTPRLSGAFGAQRMMLLRSSPVWVILRLERFALACRFESKGRVL
jgi:hypothetical protein